MRFKDILVVIIVGLSIPLHGVAQEPTILEYGAQVNTIAFHRRMPRLLLLPALATTLKTTS